MNKRELIEEVAKQTGQSRRVVRDVIETTLESIERSVKKGERVSLPGFGTFERRQRSARTARNPRTGEEINVSAKKVPAFRPGSTFKETVVAQQPPKKPRRDPL